MLRYTVICLTLAALSAVASSDRRSARSIWPFFTSETTTEEPIITEEHTRLLEQAGLGKNFDFSSHPLWRIHKYQGIDLKPVRVKTEIVPATSPNPEVPAETTTEAIDLSFLDDLGGLAYFLPEPEDNGVDDEATDLIAEAIKEDEEKELGFFKSLWKSTTRFFSSMLGGKKEVVEGRQMPNDDDDSTTIYLPETQGSYVAVVVPSTEAPSEALVPTNEAGQFRETSIAPTEQTAEELVPSNHASQFRETLTDPQAPARPSYTKSQSWVQSWSPHASYSVHINGEPTNNDSNTDAEVSDQPDPSQTSFQRKVGEDDEAEESTTEQPQEAKEEEPKKNATLTESYRDFLKSLPIPESAWKKLQISRKDIDEVLDDKEKARKALERISDKQLNATLKSLQVSEKDVAAILNNEEAGLQALERIKQKQDEFFKKWQQLKYYSYPRVRKQNHESTTIITTGVDIIV